MENLTLKTRVKNVFNVKHKIEKTKIQKEAGKDRKRNQIVATLT